MKVVLENKNVTIQKSEHKIKMLPGLPLCCAKRTATLHVEWGGGEFTHKMRSLEKHVLPSEM